MKKRNNGKIILFYLVLIVGVFVALSFLFPNNKEVPKKYGEIIQYFEDDRVQSFVIDEDYNLLLKVYPEGETESTSEIIYEIPAYIDFSKVADKYIELRNTAGSGYVNLSSLYNSYPYIHHYLRSNCPSGCKR